MEKKKKKKKINKKYLKKCFQPIKLPMYNFEKTFCLDVCRVGNNNVCGRAGYINVIFQANCEVLCLFLYSESNPVRILPWK